MKTGTYSVNFNIELTNCENEEEAKFLMFQMIRDALDNEEHESLPEVNFELLDGVEIDYTWEEEEMAEVNFEEVS